VCDITYAYVKRKDNGQRFHERFTQAYDGVVLGHGGLVVCEASEKKDVMVPDSIAGICVETAQFDVVRFIRKFFLKRTHTHTAAAA
jgi:hypothetical protein